MEENDLMPENKDKKGGAVVFDLLPRGGEAPRRPAQNAQNTQAGRRQAPKNQGSAEKPAGGKNPAAPKNQQTQRAAQPAKPQQGQRAPANGRTDSNNKRQNSGRPAQNGTKSAPNGNSQPQQGGTSPQSGGKPPLRIIPLGGLGEIGKNITMYEYGGDMFLVDCGMAFPDEDMPGVDIVIPDFSYVLANKDKIKGLVLTHGHEDHIGAIPYLLREFNVPVYGTRLTLGLVEGKLREHRLLSGAKLNVVSHGDTVTLGCFKVEFIRVNHSIPDASALAITTPVGVVVQTGDWKIDTTPINSEMINLARFAELGKKGVLLMLSDSTNAERAGYTMSERLVGESFSTLFKKAEHSRIIVATFSSNIHRIQQIIDEADRCGRKVAISGRSMVNVVSVASELGYLKIPEGILVDIDLIGKFRPEQLVIITTGSQGEPMSALYRMAFSDHRKVSIIPGDVIIISATPIPGNEKTVGRVINELMKLRAEVVYEKMYEIHVSGHACQEELKLLLGIVRPRFFMPVHGEIKHLAKHVKLASAMGIKDSNILIAENGNVIQVTHNSIKCVDKVTAGQVLVDGLGVGDVGSIVLNDRKRLAEDGIIIVSFVMDKAGQLVSGPSTQSRGFVYMRESEKLTDDMNRCAENAIYKCIDEGIRDWSTIKTKVRDTLSKFVYEHTRRSPMILPIVSEG